MPYRTLRDIDHAGLDVRLWCFECARGETVDGVVWMTFKERGWSDELPAAASRFRCSCCHSSAQVLVVPARRVDVRQVTWTRLVETWFHGQRAKRRGLRPID